MNIVILQGRLTKDPEVSFIPSTGKAVCKFTLAVDRDMSKAKKAEAKAKGAPTADFPQIVVWDKLAENCGNYLAKGRRVLLEGVHQTSTGKSKDGQTAYYTNVVAHKVEFLDHADKSEQNASGSDDGGSISGNFEPFEDENDQLPF